jgi:hypothetical protein
MEEKIEELKNSFNLFNQTINLKNKKNPLELNQYLINNDHRPLIDNDCIERCSIF